MENEKTAEQKQQQKEIDCNHRWVWVREIRRCTYNEYRCIDCGKTKRIDSGD
jgi:DNA-directed RNA polymerase subunit RPC12/RpoP